MVPRRAKNRADERKREFNAWPNKSKSGREMWRAGIMRFIDILRTAAKIAGEYGTSWSTKERVLSSWILRFLFFFRFVSSDCESNLRPIVLFTFAFVCYVTIDRV